MTTTTTSTTTTEMEMTSMTVLSLVVMITRRAHGVDRTTETIRSTETPLGMGRRALQATTVAVTTLPPLRDHLARTTAVALGLAVEAILLLPSTPPWTGARRNKPLASSTTDRRLRVGSNQTLRQPATPLHNWVWRIRHGQLDRRSRRVLNRTIMGVSCW